MKKILIRSFILIAFFSCSLKAQTNSFSGWLVLSHIQKLSPKFNINVDVQLRSKNNLNGIRNILIRPGINYNINKIWSTGIGYGYISTQTDNVAPLKPLLVENMIWEQIIATSKIKKLLLISRIRLEQRFLGQQTQDIFSQRLRLFNKLFIPLSGPKQLKEGIYLALQEELLFNVQNKDKLNTHFFDQNRALIGLGHHFNEHISSEIGYQMNAIKGKTENVNRHIIQLTFLTKLGK